jgi:hypothetical protein
MASRNLYQNSTDIVLDYLKGLALITPGIELDAEAKSKLHPSKEAEILP